MFKQIKILYDWVTDWAKSPFGAFALFVISFTEASFFPVPPDILLIALSLSVVGKAYYFAFICTIGSILGGIFGYTIGYYIWWDGESFTYVAEYFFNNLPFFTKKTFYEVQDLYKKYNIWIIFTAGFTPLPYKIFSITAGMSQIYFPFFVIASIIGRSSRFFLIAFLINKFGNKIKEYLDRYFNILSILFIFILIGFYMLFHLLINN